MTSTYERIAESLLKHQQRPKPFCKFEDNKLMTGTQSLHRTEISRRWRLFWRLKFNRM